jgi:hypothetical protein
MHDVFISHSSRDKAVADAVCSSLENRGIRCWIAPRDIPPGADWGESILNGMSGSQIMVLLLSQNANTSPQIKREVERAVNRGIVIIPVRIEDVLPASSLEYFLSTAHWLDAFPPPTDQYFGVLGSTIEQILAHRSGWHRSPGSVIRSASTAAQAQPKHQTSTLAPIWREHPLKLILLATLFFLVMATVVAGTFLILFTRSHQTPAIAKVEPITPQETESEKFIGTWRLIQDPDPSASSAKIRGVPYNSVILAAITSQTSQTTLQLLESGQFQLKTAAEDTGTFEAKSSTITFVPGREFKPLSVKFTLLPPPMPRLGLGDLDGLGGFNWTPVDTTSESGILNQAWFAYHLNFLQPDGLWLESYRAQLDLSDGHNYHLKLSSNINGKYQFKNGHFLLTESGLTAQTGTWEGTYTLKSPSTLQLTDPNSKTTWTKLSK